MNAWIARQIVCRAQNHVDSERHDAQDPYYNEANVHLKIAPRTRGALRTNVDF
jgi:hypothetical protein